MIIGSAFLRSWKVTTVNKKTCGNRAWSTTVYRKSQLPLKVEKPSAHVVMMEGKNYSTWKAQLKMLLIKDEVFGIVNSTTVAPAKCTTADLVKKDWALAIIVARAQWWMVNHSSKSGCKSCHSASSLQSSYFLALNSLHSRLFLVICLLILASTLI